MRIVDFETLFFCETMGLPNIKIKVYSLTWSYLTQPLVLNQFHSRLRFCTENTKKKKMQAFKIFKEIHLLFFILICGQKPQSINATKICTDSRSEELFADLVCKYTFIIKYK